MILEIFVIPGFGIAGIAGILFMMGGLYLSLLGSLEQLESSDFTAAAGYLSLSFIITFFGVVILIKLFPKTSIWRRISLDESQLRDKGYIASRDYSKYIGKKGKALSALRPAGVGQFGKERLDIVSEGEFIDKDTTIVISQVDGYRLIVKPVEKKKNG